MVVNEKTDFREIARDGGTVLSYRAGDFIFREGDTAGFMYVVLKGSVRCRRGTRPS
jgi:CRP-like cAMP-binding protein